MKQINLNVLTINTLNSDIRKYKDRTVFNKTVTKVEKQVQYLIDYIKKEKQ